MGDPFRRPAFATAVYYRDPRAAMAWLERAFGFEPTMLISDPSGTLVHGEMRYAGGVIYVGQPWNVAYASPADTDGRNTAGVHVHIEGDLEAHCDKARAAGAEIVQAPEDQFYGDRTYRARDSEGHIWTFAKFMRFVPRADAEKATGLKIEAKGWE